MDDSTTKRCSKCDVEQPREFFTKAHWTKDGLYPSCKACKRAQSKARRESHPDEHRARAVAYHHAHQEERNAKNRAYYVANRAQVIARTRQYTLQHPEILRKSKQKWIAAHREQHLTDTRQRSVAWRAKNLEKSRNAAKRRIARVRGAEGTHTLAEWRALKAHYQYRCLCCGKSEPQIVLTEDHVIPVTKGGSDSISNIQPLCKHCNSSKRTRSTDYRP